MTPTWNGMIKTYLKETISKYAPAFGFTRHSSEAPDHMKSISPICLLGFAQISDNSIEQEDMIYFQAEIFTQPINEEWIK
jgi:hypothetical protein